MSNDPSKPDDTLPVGRAQPASIPVDQEAETLTVKPLQPPRPATSVNVDQGTETLMGHPGSPTRPATEQGPTEPIESASTAQGSGKVVGYEILAELGRGGMGVVYKARQIRLKRLVALKMILSGIHAGAKERVRFRQEAETIASLQHPNIVQIYEVGEENGLPYFSMEIVEGKSLQQILNGIPQNPRQAAQLMEVLARTMHFAHQHGIVHRDLKPGNILLATAPAIESQGEDAETRTLRRVYGIPKIMDFGLAKHLDSDAAQTRTGDLLGTPSYMSPEQASGKAGDVGPATDIYALGAILYEMLTGRPPFRTASALDTLWQVLNEDPKAPSSVHSMIPRDLERICLKCLEKDPRRRYGSALDLADDLRRHLNGEAVHARPVGPLRRLWLWCRRNPLPTSFLVAVTLGSAFGLWEMSRLSDSLVHQSAIESAKHQSEIMDEVNHYYANLLGSLEERERAAYKKTGKKQAHGTDLLPAPATLTIELGKQISERSTMGMNVRLYSEYPFKKRRATGDWGPRDDFERQALAVLQQNPDKPYYRFEEYKGRMSLRYATARLMTSECIACHNTHPDNPKHDWKVGDLRGVLEIIRPLDADVANIRQGLQETFLIIGATGALLLLVSGMVLYLANRAR